PCFRNDRGIDADHFTGHVHERTTTITGIDGGIRLKEALEIVSRSANIRASLGADDSMCDGVIQAERTSDSQYPVAYLYGFGVSQLCNGQIPSRFDLDDSKVSIHIAADQLR